MRLLPLLVSLLVLDFFFSSASSQQLWLPSYYSSNMVLQRDSPSTTIWGTCQSGNVTMKLIPFPASPLGNFTFESKPSPSTSVFSFHLSNSQFQNGFPATIVPTQRGGKLQKNHPRKSSPSPALTVEYYQIQISCGSDSVLFDDVLIGDIWLCSGQSNMV